MNRLEKMAFAAAMLLMADPALAGLSVVTPAPIAGIGLGAVVLIGLGYRALKSRNSR
jgi:hypothetical protein